MREHKLKGTGTIRLIVVKHNDQNHGRFGNPNTIAVISADFFSHGFICKKSWDDKISYPQYTEDMIREEAEVVADHLKDMPNGFYEIIAGLGYTSWRTSYEYEEYEHEWDLLNPKIQEITYRQAAHLDKFDVIKSESIDLMTRLSLDKDQNLTWVDTAINQFMPKKEIMARHALTLTKLYDPYGGKYLCDFTAMTEKQLQDYIHMSMLMIDSESLAHEEGKRRHKIATIIDEDVLHWEDLRSNLFDNLDE